MNEKLPAVVTAFQKVFDEVSSLKAAIGDAVAADTPPAPPAIVESPDGTMGTVVYDSKVDKWTIEGVNLLRNSFDTTGRGTVYLYFNHEVYTLGMDSNWWVWRDEKWALYGAKAPNGVLIGPHGDQPTVTCVNLAVASFWGGIDPFINRFQRAGRWWHRWGAPLAWYVDRPDNYLLGIPAGEAATNLVQVQDSGGHLDLTEQRAGKHILLWKGDLDMTVGGVGVEAGVVAAKGRYEFNIPPTIEVDGVLTLANPSLNFDVFNNTAVTQDMLPVIENGVQYPALIHADDEADFLAGKTFQKSFFNSLSGAKMVRTMDLNQCVTEGVDAYGKVSMEVIEPVHFMKPNYRTFETPNDRSLFFPPEMVGIMAREGNLSVFNTMQTKCSDKAFDYWGERYAATVGSGWSGELLSELGDENWNFAWPWNIGGTYLATHIAPTIKVVDIDGNPSQVGVDMIGCGCASRALALWTAMERHIPRARHKRVLGAQGAWTAGMGGMLSYVDPATNTKVSEMADYYAIAPYWGCDLSDITVDQMLDGRLWETKPVEWWIERVTRVIDRMEAGLYTTLDFLKKYAPNLKLTMYEGNGWLTEMRLPGVNDPKYAAAVDFDHWMRTFMDTEPGKVITEYYWEHFIKGNFAHFNAYMHQGYYFGVQVGLHNSQFRPDTQRQKFFRSLGS